MDYDCYTDTVWWKMEVIRVVEHKVYYFDLDGVYTCVLVAKAQDMGLAGVDIWDGDYYCFDIQIMPEYVKRAIFVLEEGDNVKDFVKDIERIKKFQDENPIGVLNTVYLVKDEKYYFFNSEGIYSCLDEKNMLKLGIRIQIYRNRRDYKYVAVRLDKLKKILGKEEYDRDFLKEVLFRLKVGDKLEQIEECYNELIKENEKWLVSVERFVTRIYKPEFVCTPENSKKAQTFDYIHVDVNLIKEWNTDKIEFVNENQKKIHAMVLESIKNDSQFKKYGITINCLKIARVTLRRDLSSIHYVLELKK